MAHLVIGAGIKNAEPEHTRPLPPKPQSATYAAPNLKFSAAFAATPASVHNNLGDFLTNSSVILQQNNASSAQTNANLKAYQGYVPNKNSVPENHNFIKNADAAQQPKLEPLNVIQQQIQARMPMQHSTQAAKAPDAPVIAQPKIMGSDHKGYGAKLTTDPVLSIMIDRASNDSGAIGFGYIGAVTRRESSSSNDQSSSDEWSLQRETKAKPEVKSVSPKAHTAQKVADIENLQRVTMELTKQLQKSHPCVSVPIQHPDGVVDINLRFSSNGSVRALFAGSNPEVVQLMAQHRDQFIKTINNEGYQIDERQMGFIHQTLTSDTIRI